MFVATPAMLEKVSSSIMAFLVAPCEWADYMLHSQHGQMLCRQLERIQEHIVDSHCGGPLFVSNKEKIV